jgi:L-asparaginase
MMEEKAKTHRECSVNPTVLNIAEAYEVFSPEKKPNILVLFCGGTLIMRENEDGSLVVNDKDVAIDLLLGMEPRINEYANIEVHYIDNIDSSNMCPELWDMIGGVINEKYFEYDGFVITHGTDTMAYTASALSFVLGDLGKPVTITGAQIPGGRIESDARRNFVNAVRVATLSKPGVMLIFDGDIILGSRAHKLSESKLDAFGPINWVLLGEIRIDVRFSDEAKERHDRALQFRPGFESNISVITLFPGFPSQSLEAAVIMNPKGIVLRSYGSGNISYKYLDALKLAKTRNIPIVVTTQCLEGATLMHLYDVGKQALDLGVIQSYDMSTESAITKLMWALKRAESHEELVELFYTNFTGEINKEGKLY